jgi:acetyl/propionyl-CoA carboxylase alpha subunit
MAEFLDNSGSAVQAANATQVHCDAQGIWWVRVGKKNHRVELHTNDAGLFEVRVDGKSGSLKKHGLREQLMERMGISNAVDVADSSLTSPMPGKVLEIRVKPGDRITSGAALVVLEAMKMENVLAATSDVEIANVLVQPGESVEKGAVLLEFA